MANRNFDSSAIIQRLQNRIYSRNLYNNNTTGQRVINNPQTTDGNSSRYVLFHSGAQTEYFRTLEGTTMVSEGGTANIPPYPSVPSTTTTTGTVPSAPTRLNATSGNTQVTVSFLQQSTGGSAITNYQYSTDNGTTFRAFSPPDILNPVVISTLSTDGTTPLTNGTTYPIKLKAVNANGASDPSNAVAGTPATVPSTPTTLAYTPGDTQLSIVFTQGFDGGSPITNYQYSTDDGATFTACSPPVISIPVIITGLTNGTTYQVKIKAVNAVGTSDPSAALAATPNNV